MTVGFATPLQRTVQPTHSGPDGITARITVDADEQVFRGHYPGFPIFPGVCLVECVHHAAHTRPPAPGRPVLTAVESVRFLSPVFPGDEVSVELTWKLKAGSWKAYAAVSTARGKSAQIRLAYEFEAAGAETAGEATKSVVLEETS
ncbi:3-hydroxyacyl-ACP dehydratase FabZ family protein [Streptomyces sp. CG1]|uniref:3-hydroxyacyl-ACP dehydratase FabZ family protein n=1 Tax=Streptomyces sp. CG1 TaxID=1287523 RepID=UPI0034E22115